MALCVIIHYDQGRRRSRFTPRRDAGHGRGGSGERNDLPGLRGTQRPRCGILLCLRRVPGLGRSGGRTRAARPADDRHPRPVQPRPTRSAPPSSAPAPPAAPAPERAPVPSDRSGRGRRPAGSPVRRPIRSPGRRRRRALNAAAPALGTQLPGALGQGARLLGAPSTLGGAAQGALSQGMPWRGSGRNEAPPQQPPPGYDPAIHQSRSRPSTTNSTRRRPNRRRRPKVLVPVAVSSMGPNYGSAASAGWRCAARRCTTAAVARPVAPPERVPWWRRWFRPGDNTRRGARAAYRRSLPVRYRIIRWVLALLGVAAIIGAFALIGRNPVGWAVNTWNDMLGKTAQVNDLDAYTDPNPAEIAEQSRHRQPVGRERPPTVHRPPRRRSTPRRTCWTTCPTPRGRPPGRRPPS